MGVFIGQGLKFILFPLRHSALLIIEHKVLASYNHALILYRAGDTVRHNIFHLGVHFLMGKPFLFGSAHYRVRHGMGIMLLQTGGGTQHFIAILSAKGHNVYHGGARAG